MARGGTKSFFRLIEQFSTQAEPAYCGPSTLCVVLNALAVDPRRTWKGVWRWYEEEMLNSCIDLEMVKKKGVTFGTFACLARCQGVAVEARWAEDSTVEEFRRAVRACCTEEGNSSSDEASGYPVFLVTSYSRRVIEQTGDGHYSPVAAFDEVSDKVLILDTARFKYGPHWVPLQLLFDAMIPIDKDTGRSRGYLLLSFKGDDTSSNLPLQSILFRSKKSHDPVRQQFKKFLDSRQSNDPAAFEEVESFWKKGGKEPKFIFDMIEPQLVPVNEREAQIVEDVCRLIQLLISDIPRLKAADEDELTECCGPRCGANASRNIPITAIEAIFIVYLATLPPDQRKGLVYSGHRQGFGRFSDEVLDQLIRESELVQYAIEMSCTK
mmetsp:Transcript_43291/g.131743  ORF Transcript_43291/g.131743 Transcript_43291/m.131743 type:complete len:381 (-) Transcript_43291:130-1272(-)